MIENKRISAVDMARGIAILLVFLGHCPRPSMCDDYAWCNFIYEYVYSFHVSLLFIISGITFALTKNKNIQKSTGSYLLQKSKTILLPWISYSFIIFLFFRVINLIGPFKQMFEGSKYKIFGLGEYLLAMLKNENPYSFHVWYLQTLFLYVIITYIIEKYLPKWSKTIKIYIIVLMPLFYSLFCDDFVWGIKGFFQKYFFFLAGTLLPISKIDEKKKILTVIGAFSAVILAFFANEKADALFEIPIAGQFIGYGYNLIIFMTCIGIFAACFYVKNIKNPIALLGRNSMLYYMYHQPFCCAFVGMLLYEKMNLPAALTMAVCFVCSIIAPFLISKVIHLLRLEKVFRIIGLPC